MTNLKNFMSFLDRNYVVTPLEKGVHYKNAWGNFIEIFNEELNKPKNYSYRTLQTYYFLQFLYMSKDWVEKNFEKIFDKSDHIGWLCAIHGYAFNRKVHLQFFEKFLLLYFDDAINDPELVEDKKDRLISFLIVSLKSGRSHDDKIDLILNSKLSIIDCLGNTLSLIFKDNESKEVALNIWCKAVEKFESKPDFLITFVQCLHLIDDLDERNMFLAKSLAPHISRFYKDYIWLEELSRLSENYPQEVFELISISYENSLPFGCNQELKEIVDNLHNAGLTKELTNLSSLFIKNRSDLIFNMLKEKSGS